MKRLNSFLLLGIVPGFLFFSSLPASASAFHLGLAAGGDYTMLQGTSSLPPLHITSMNGFSYAAAVMLNFFQDSVFGFELSEDLANANLSFASDTFQAQALYSSFIPRVNFNLLGNRHSFGVGYAYGFLAGSGSLGTIAAPSPLQAIAIEGKDMWKVGESHYLFLVARGFINILSNNSTNLFSMSLLLGFDI